MNSEEQQRFMQMAVDLSQYSVDSNVGGPFGAIIVKGNKVAGSSVCIYPEQHSGIHAEVLAIRDACRNLKTLDLSGCKIYASSEPCPMCLAAIYWAQISEIYFCNSENNIVSLGYDNHHTQQKHEISLNINSVKLPNTKAIKVAESKITKRNRTGIAIPME